MTPVNRIFGSDATESIEKTYNAKYVIDACLKAADGSWINSPAAIFHTEVAHPAGSNYMALYWSEIHNGWMITDGIGAVEGVFNGVLFDDGELVHSRFRHDYFVHREAMADGARDYYKTSGCPEGSRHIKFKVDGPNLVEYTMEDQLIEEYDRMAAMMKKVA